MNVAGIREASERDAAEILALLKASDLPTADLGEARPEFFVAIEGSRLIGCAALQRFGAVALVRSVAVHADRRGTGVGQSLVASLEQHARGSGLTELVLLTETAQAFFETQGYRPVDRARVSLDVQASEEFRALCPQSAVCLSKRL